MEYTQWVDVMEKKTVEGLNPCCNGIYSMRGYDIQGDKKNEQVLILVVMEYTQWAI